MLGMGCECHTSASELNLRPFGASTGTFHARVFSVPPNDQNLPRYTPLRLLTKNINKVEQQIKEKLDRPAGKGRRQCPSGTPGDAIDAPIEHFQQKDKSVWLCIPVCKTLFFYSESLKLFFSLPRTNKPWSDLWYGIIRIFILPDRVIGSW